MRLSACSIVKNESKNIARSIESYKGVVDEIIIVDTGSTDDTVEICKKLGAKVLHFEWINDFAAAKNYALEHAKGDWIIFLDADEWFMPKLDDDRIFKVLDKVEKMDDVGVIRTTLCNVDENTGFTSSKTSCARIFRNAPDVRYVGKIHEDIRKNGMPIKPVTLEELEIFHCGYSGKKVDGKSKRNLEILYDIYRKGKADTAIYFYLCRENSIIGNFNEALKFYELLFKQKDCEEVIKSANIFVSIYETGVLIKQHHMDKFRTKDFLEDIETAIEKYPLLPKHLYLKGIYYFNFDYSEALRMLKEAVRLHKEYKGPYLNSFGTSLPDAYFKIAQIYRARHMLDKAFDNYVLCIKEQKTNEAAFRELLQLIRDQSNEDIILFLNSIYDIKNKDHVQFLAKQLMASKLNTVFLYYAMKYNREFDGQDETTYIAMILANKEEDAVETAMTAYFNAGREEDRYFAALAMMCKRRLDLYEKYKSSLNHAFSSVLNKYFRDEKIINPTKDEVAAFLYLFRYMFYIGSQDDIEALESMFDEIPLEVVAGMMECYVSYKDIYQTIKKATYYSEVVKSEHYKAQMHKILGYSYYLIKDYTKSIEHFEITLNNRHCDMDQTMMVYLKLISEMKSNDIISHKALKLHDNYSPIFEEFVAASDMVRTGKLDDISDEGDLERIKTLTRDSFLQMIEPESVKLPDTALNILFNLAEKFLEKDMDVCAHNTIIRLLKNEFKKDILYYRLGEIYSRLQNPELSLYCHNMVFEQNATFAETLIIDRNNDNRNYIFKTIESDSRKKCPICGKISKLHSVYNTIVNPDFSPEYPAIKVWCYCADCHHMFAADMPKEISFEMEDEKAESEIKAIAQNILGYDESVREIRSLAKGNKLLDVGSGNGTFMAAAMEYGFDACGVEPVKNLAALSSKLLGVKVYDCGFEDLKVNGTYDVATMGCVIESLREPKQTVQIVCKLLNDGGLLYIETPNFDSGYARAMKDKIWTLRSGRILNYFSKTSLENMLKNCGFGVLSYRMSKRNRGYMEVMARKQDRIRV